VIEQLTGDRILPLLKAATKKEVLQELADAIHSEHPSLSEKEIYDIIMERESLGSTGIGNGIAIPHGKTDKLRDIVVYFGRSGSGIPFDALDGKPVHLFFVLLAPENSAGPYLNCLARVSGFLKNPAIRKRLMAAPGKEELMQVLTEVV